MSNIVQIDYHAIATKHNYVYIGPCGCRRKKGFDFQKGDFVLRVYPRTVKFTIYKLGRSVHMDALTKLDNILSLPRFAN